MESSSSSSSSPAPPSINQRRSAANKKIPRMRFRSNSSRHEDKPISSLTNNQNQLWTNERGGDAINKIDTPPLKASVRSFLETNVVVSGNTKSDDNQANCCNQPKQKRQSQAQTSNRMLAAPSVRGSAQSRRPLFQKPNRRLRKYLSEEHVGGGGDGDQIKSSNARSSPKILPQNVGGSFKRKSKISSAVVGKSVSAAVINSSENELTKNSRPSIIGMSVENLCNNNRIRRPLINLLSLLYFKGSETPDIFRKAPNYRKASAVARELTTSLTETNQRSSDDFKTSQSSNHRVLLSLVDEPHMVASIVKRFLMRLEQPFFDQSICSLWNSIAIENRDSLNEDNFHEKIAATSQLIGSMQQPKSLFWTYFLTVLHKIHQNKARTRMDSENLAICISGTLFKNDSCTLDSACNMSKIAADFVSFNIEHCHRLVSSVREITCVLEMHLSEIIDCVRKTGDDDDNPKSPVENESDNFVQTSKMSEQSEKSDNLCSRLHRRLDTVKDRMRDTAKRIDFKAKTFRRSSLLERFRGDSVKTPKLQDQPVFVNVPQSLNTPQPTTIRGIYENKLLNNRIKPNFVMGSSDDAIYAYRKHNQRTSPTNVDQQQHRRQLSQRPKPGISGISNVFQLGKRSQSLGSYSSRQQK